MIHEQTRQKVIADWTTGFRNLGKAFREFDERTRNHPDRLWVTPIVSFQNGDATALHDLLISETPLSSEVRDTLARALVEVTAKPKEKRGKKRNKAAHDAAWAANMFYRAWRDENKKVGINDWGDASQMKDDALRTVIEIDIDLKDVHFSTARDLMDR